MKIFAIKDEANDNKAVAYLFYYEKPNKFYIELPDQANEWDTPLILSSFIKKGKMTVDSSRSKTWVQQRIVPSDRQNLSHILRDNNLKAYDEYELLMLHDGRCEQDDYYLSPIEFSELPEEIKNRRLRKIDDIVPLENNKLLVFFEDGIVKACDISKIIKPSSPLGILLKIRPEVFPDFHMQPGGYGIYWDDNMTISNDDLYENGKTVPLSKHDFITFASLRTVNTAEAADMLNCSRQNINDLIKRKKLTPIKENDKSKLFLKSDIEKREWV